MLDKTSTLQNATLRHGARSRAKPERQCRPLAASRNQNKGHSVLPRGRPPRIARIGWKRHGGGLLAPQKDCQYLTRTRRDPVLKEVVRFLTWPLDFTRDTDAARVRVAGGRSGAFLETVPSEWPERDRFRSPEAIWRSWSPAGGTSGPLSSCSPRSRGVDRILSGSCEIPSPHRGSRTPRRRQR